MDPWPFRHLVLRTPRLELRPDDDAGLLELAEEAKLGIHPPDFMPFLTSWSSNPAHEIIQHYWTTRGSLTPAKWTVNFLVRVDGRVIGMQGATGKDFAVTREVDTGSWLGQRHQGKGYGTEMRAAVAMLMFDHLKAEQMTSGAFTDNTASQAVSRKLGYVLNGTDRLAIEGKPRIDNRFLLTRERFAEFRPEWTVQVDGLDDCLPLLDSSVG
jgi:RimJ/RimL family protein N-acetyltransferase